jgi:Tfp pilus assembly PilM family ATPase
MVSLQAEKEAVSSRLKKVFMEAKIKAADSRAVSIASSTAETENLLKEAKITAKEAQGQLTASLQEVDALHEEYYTVGYNVETPRL